MPSRSESKRAKLQSWLASHAPEHVDSDTFDRIRRDVGPVSERYLRQLLRASGIPLSPEVEGVSAGSLGDLRRTLTSLAGAYVAGRKETRQLVIDAKNLLKWAELRTTDTSKKQLQAEMMLWMMTWLENPESFELWVQLRERSFTPLIKSPQQ